MPRKSRPVPKRQIPQNKEALRSLMQLNDAVALHHQGRLKEAQDIYKSILRNNPSSFETINLLATVPSAAPTDKAVNVSSPLCSKSDV